MELQKLIRASGFFLSSIVTLSLGILFLGMIASNLISLSGFVFILPIFIGAIVLRATTWRRIYLSAHKTIYLVTFVLVLALGFATLIGFLVYASSQTILYYLSGYSGDTIIIAISLLWAAYSILEFISLYNLFRRSIFKLVRLMIVPIALIEASIIFLLGYFSYILPLSMFLLSGFTCLAGLGFVFD